MKRRLFYVLPFVLLAVPACRTAGPKPAVGVPKSPDILGGYVDELRLLRDKGDKSRVKLDARSRVSDGCAVAVRVRSAEFAKRQARLSLEALGRPRLNGRAGDCRRVAPLIELVVSGFPASARPAEVTARVDAVLQTPEAYLASKGVRFDLAPAELSADVASRETFATSAESRAARTVTAWPVALLSVDPWYRAPSDRVRQESQVEVDAVVGSDGRLHRSRCRTALSDVHEKLVVRSLGLWRFTPARRASGPVAARVALQPVLHID